jgi:uncharacterized protein (DUF2336 family)
MSTTQGLIDELAEVTSHHTAGWRGDAAQRITDLFVAGSGLYSDDQIALFDDVFVRLVRKIETAARAILAGRLAPLANAPPLVIRILAFDDAIEVAGPVLAHSERLDDSALVENARTKSQRHLLAISRRKSLSEAVTNVLVERGGLKILQKTAENHGARFSDNGYAMLVRRAEGVDRLAIHIGSRPDIPRHHFLRLLSKASKTVRHKLEAENPLEYRAIQRVVSEVESKIRAGNVHVIRDYTAARALVQSLHDAGELGDRDVEALARAGKLEETTAALALLCNLPIGAVEQAMLEHRPESILTMAKAAGLSWYTTKFILLSRTRASGMSTHELELCLQAFERLKAETARQIVHFQRVRTKNA